LIETRIEIFAKLAEARVGSIDELTDTRTLSRISRKISLVRSVATN
jgi:hypothetical protein